MEEQRDYIYLVTDQDGTIYRDYRRQYAFEHYQRNHSIKIEAQDKSLFPTKRIIVDYPDADLSNLDENDCMRKTTRERREQFKAYDREHTKQFKLKLNLETDADIIEFLQNSGNMQGTIKELIREKINENNAQKVLIPTYISGTMLMYPKIV